MVTKASGSSDKFESRGNLTPKILVLDDDTFVLRFFEMIFKEEGYLFFPAKSCKECKNLLKKETFHLCILDVRLPDGNGIDLMKWIRKQGIDFPIIIITAYGSISDAVQAIKIGAFDFATKPFDNTQKIKISIKNALNQVFLSTEIQELRFQLESTSHLKPIIGKSNKIVHVLNMIQKAARVESNILIDGESGTGKELVAKAIHEKSDRRGRPFVAINCVALPETLLESSLFGYEKGAFTGATKKTKGFFEEAHSGTLLLDEIGDATPSLQAKILRAVEEHTVLHVGGTKPIFVDVRLIFSTNKNLVKEVAEGRFRRDLYYRINVIKITLPPLRERKEDIPLLAEYFINQHCVKSSVPKKHLERSAIRHLINSNWPGNVRELQNLMERVVALHHKGSVTAEDLSQYRDEKTFKDEENYLNEDYSEAKRYFEKKYFENLIAISDGDMALAAKNSQVHRATIYRKIKELGIKNRWSKDRDLREW